jgi:hypothetical protein
MGCSSDGKKQGEEIRADRLTVGLLDTVETHARKNGQERKPGGGIIDE